MTLSLRQPSRRDGSIVWSVVAGVGCLAVISLLVWSVTRDSSRLPVPVETAAPVSTPASQSPLAESNEDSDPREGGEHAPVSEDEPNATDAAAAPTTKPQVDGEPLRAELLGRWILNDSIRRDIIVREDGGATMDVTLDFLSSLFYGSKMTLQLEWSVVGNELTHKIVSGVPPKNVAKLIDDYGDSRTYQIIQLTDQEMLLEELNGGERYRWRRAPVAARTSR